MLKSERMVAPCVVHHFRAVVCAHAGVTLAEAR